MWLAVDMYFPGRRWRQESAVLYWSPEWAHQMFDCIRKFITDRDKQPLGLAHVAYFIHSGHFWLVNQTTLWRSLREQAVDFVPGMSFDKPARTKHSDQLILPSHFSWATPTPEGPTLDNYIIATTRQKVVIDRRNTLGADDIAIYYECLCPDGRGILSGALDLELLEEAAGVKL